MARVSSAFHLACNVSIISDTTESAANTTVGDDALKNPVVGLTALARRVESAHFSDSTATRDMVPETTTGIYVTINSTLYLARNVSLSSQKTILRPTLRLVMMKSSQGKPLN